MENVVTEKTNIPAEITDLNDSESSEKFQKFIHELFEKNGVLNDLRAYLRGHIVEILKSAETGDPTTCQKNFTQRLELTFQAINILIVEYLHRLEFNYTLSVFTSEIPLSNMVFNFAKALMKTTDSTLSELRFSESDIWSILSYLGVKCDSDHAYKIVETYKCQTGSPLLCCILKYIEIYNESICLEQVHTSEESLSCHESEISTKDKAVSSHDNTTPKCKHYAFCKVCQNRVSRLKEKYKKKKMKLVENPKTSEVNTMSIDNFMKNVGMLEQSLIDEMFQQLKTVYETEVDMIRNAEEKKIKRSLASHALQLQSRQEELEKCFHERQAELEQKVQHRQRFLWGLARALREQRRRLEHAQAQLAQQHTRLAGEENNLKIQLQDAEQTLKKKGEEMHNQISEELTMLRNQLEIIKQEKEVINNERIEIENLKEIYENNILKEKNTKENEELKLHCDLLKDEIIILRKYIESSKTTKCVTERGTVTDGDEVKSLMNNENVGSCKSDDDRMKVKQVVNNLKKRKNVNFIQSNLDDLELHQQRGSVASAEDVRSETQSFIYDTVQQLKEENERLKVFARQQSEHIERLSIERHRLQETRESRPRTVPSVISTHNYLPQRIDPYVGELGVQPRVLLPGDAIPFIGAVGNRQCDDRRRRLFNQWRNLQPHRSPDEPRTQPSTVIIHDTGVMDNEQTDGISQPKVCENTQKIKPGSLVNDEIRGKSPKSIRREAKPKLRDSSKKGPTSIPREKSPNDMLREAKLRLRKLEIEAEAVERSYLDFRKKQTSLRGKRDNLILDEVSITENVKNLGTKQSNNLLEQNKKFEVNDFSVSQEAMKKDFDKYFREYQNINFDKMKFQNMNSIEQVRPIPKSYSELCESENVNYNINYLETPLIEFRKLYQTPKSTSFIRKPNDSKTLNENNDTENKRREQKQVIQKIKSDKKIDLQIEDVNTNNDIHNINSPSESEKDILKTDTRKENNKLDENFVNDINLDVSDVSKNNIDEVKDKPKDNENQLVGIDDQKPEIDIIADEVNEEIMDLVQSNDNISNSKVENEENYNVKNLLMIEVESVCETSNMGVTESNQDLLVIVESSLDNNKLVLTEGNNDEKLSTQMTIIVSPKQDSDPKDIGEMQEISKLTENDELNDIYRANGNEISSVDIPLDINKQDSNSDIEREIQEYPDDFSADVDNYNSQSEYDKNSPISLPKTSEDDNFWDS